MLGRFLCQEGVDARLGIDVAAKATSQPVVRYVRESRHWSVNTSKGGFGSVFAVRCQLG